MIGKFERIVRALERIAAHLDAEDRSSDAMLETVQRLMKQNEENAANAQQHYRSCEEFHIKQKETVDAWDQALASLTARVRELERRREPWEN